MNSFQVNARLIYYSHSLEKGLSHDNIRYGFGKNAMIGLSRAVRVYNNSRFSKTGKAYKNSLSVVDEYIKIHKSGHHNIKNLISLFDSEFIDDIKKNTSKIGGFSIVKKNTYSKSRSFKDVIENRSSVRTYSNEPVDIIKINRAIELSMKSPSVCNRQPYRVYVIKKTDIINKTLDIQAGMVGYPLPPFLIVVTSDISCFVSLNERNQVYIDGGIFCMSLLLSMEYEGLASCPLNAMLNKKNDRKIRNILQIPERESLIMFASVGNFNECSKVAKSFRYSAEDIVTYIE